jgi:hypothetical protein
MTLRPIECGIRVATSPEWLSLLALPWWWCRHRVTLLVDDRATLRWRPFPVEADAVGDPRPPCRAPVDEYAALAAVMIFEPFELSEGARHIPAGLVGGMLGEIVAEVEIIGPGLTSTAPNLRT